VLFLSQGARRLRLITDHRCFDINCETLKLAPKEAMQFGKAIERILAKIVTANPEHIFCVFIDQHSIELKKFRRACWRQACLGVFRSC
jgi:hypothetical protein